MVLVVHHRASLRRLLTTALSPIGEPVVTASTGEQALALLEDARRPFELLITANVLPGMNGPELANLFRAKMGATAPVIITSAYERPPRGACDVFIAEPFEVEDVLRHVERLLAVRARAR